MPKTILESVLTGSLSLDTVVKWLNIDSYEDTPEDCEQFCCSRSEFVAYFLSYLRNETNNILKPKGTVNQRNTPEKILSRRKHRRSCSEPNSEGDNDSLSIRTDHQRSVSPKKKTGRRVKTKLFNESRDGVSISSDESRINSGFEKLFVSSTPLKNGRPDPMTPSPVPRNHSSYERCDTPRSRRSIDKSSMSLGDFLPASMKSSKKKKPQKVQDIDLSSSEFPEIGRKASSEKRRIKPTIIESTPRKSLSMNSFNSESFQQPSLVFQENEAFKHQKIQPKQLSASFDAERSILKQDKSKLLEKFSNMNTSQQKFQSTPQIKVLKETTDIVPDYVSVELNKVTLKDKIDILVNIYSLLISNCVLSLGGEIYFLISILMSNQTVDDFTNTENNINNLLKNINNVTYFTVKSLWNLRSVLEVVIEKSTLKLLGEHKRVRSFYPELAKFLLNSYGVKCEIESSREEKSDGFANGMVCFNIETDNVDNFPNAMSFQNFKKQRDMFYEILRWYNDSQHSTTSKSTFRARVKTLLSLATSPANHAHLARLMLMHMLAECLPVGQQESKMSKLQRRLIGPPVQDSNRLPSFSQKELFYKEFIIFAENESFRTHLKDSLTKEICLLDSMQIVNEEVNSTLTDLSRDYAKLSKKLRLLSKFLGFLTELPYSQAPVDFSIKMGICDSGVNVVSYGEPKERILENGIAVRCFNQPTIDLKRILSDAKEKGHLCTTIPWIVTYLSMLDYTTLRTRYFHEIIDIILEIYTTKLRNEPKKQYFKRKTQIYIKMTLGWLFDLQQFPQEFFLGGHLESKMADAGESIDKILDIDEATIIDLCPFLKDINYLLSSSKPIDSRNVCSFRHITPVSLNVNVEDRLRNKEKELQSRLEAAILKSVGSSNRRLVELVAERASSAAAKAIRQKIGEQNDQDVERMLTESRKIAKDFITPCVAMALQALMPAGNTRQVLEAIAIKASEARVEKWIATRLTDIQVDPNSSRIEQPQTTERKPPSIDKLLLPEAEFDRVNVSPSAVIIELKEQICLYLDRSPANMAATLAQCGRICANVFTRPPTQRALLHATVDAAVVIVSRRPKDLTPDILQKLDTIWNKLCPDRNGPDPTCYEPDNRPDMSDSRAPTPDSDGEIPIIDMNDIVMINNKSDVKTVDKSDCKTVKDSDSDLLDYFNRILCPRNVKLLSDIKSDGDVKNNEVWEKMGTLLVFLLSKYYLSEDSLTEQCLAVFRQDWTQDILEGMSLCMKCVASKWSSSGKLTLFLEFLSEYCGDV